MLLKAEQLEAQREASAKALLLHWREEGHRAEAQQSALGVLRPAGYSWDGPLLEEPGGRHLQQLC